MYYSRADQLSVAKQDNYFKEKFFGKPEYHTIIKTQASIPIEHRVHRVDVNGSSGKLYAWYFNLKI